MRTKRTKKKPQYQPVIKLPPLSYEQFAALKENIAVNGVVVPIVVDDAPEKNIIDGSYRKRIAEELGYDCPETVQAGLDADEKRILARALNLSRRQLTNEQRRQLIADQLEESPGRSNRWVAKMLGVHHSTVGAVRGELQTVGQLSQLERRVGTDGKTYRSTKAPAPRAVVDRQRRIDATTLIQGDCTKELKKIQSGTVDCVITDPPYPCVDREYGRMTEAEWFAMMRKVVAECRRILTPTGSAVIILQPNAKQNGSMRLWLWEFLIWAGREWNIVQDAYWWAVDCMPLAGASRKIGLMRPSVKTCIWLGPANCHRNQDKVLWTPSQATSAKHRADIALRTTGPSGLTYRNSTIAKAADERGGTTPFNLLPISAGGEGKSFGHPARTPYNVAAWWSKYLCPEGGTVVDPFAGEGTVLEAALDHGASRVIGIERQARYLRMARKRLFG